MKSNYLILLFIFFISCKGFEPLTMQKNNVNVNNLKTNGYYYIFKNKEYNYVYKEMRYNAFFLYNNGIFYGGNWSNILDFNKENLSSLDEKISKIYSIDKDYPIQTHWGVFDIKGSEILIERWVTASGAGAYPTQILKGDIKNDSTIHFHTLIGAYPVNTNSKKKTVNIDETYHFRQFSPKPDSTNKFIK